MFQKNLQELWLLGLAIPLAMSAGLANASNFQVVGSIKTSSKNIGLTGSLSADTAGNLYAVSANSQYLLELRARSGYSNTEMLYEYTAIALWSVSLTPANVIIGSALGGPDAGGLVYNLGKAGSIAFTAVHLFSGEKSRPTDGAFPSGQTRGLFGRYYGTTRVGGIPTGNQSDPYGDHGGGTVYGIDPSTTTLRYGVLHKFAGPGDGLFPTIGNLAVDAQGNLYGQTYGGGANGVGTVYTMRYVEGGWQEQILYSFKPAHDLDYPAGNVVLDADGALYGCAETGAYRHGGIFRLAPPATPGAATTVAAATRAMPRSACKASTTVPSDQSASAALMWPSRRSRRAARRPHRPRPGRGARAGPRRPGSRD